MTKYTITIDVDQPLPSAKRTALQHRVEEALDRFFGSVSFGIDFSEEQIDLRKGLTATSSRSSLIQDR